MISSCSSITTNNSSQDIIENSIRPLDTRTTNRLSNSSLLIVDKIHIGMTLDEMKKQYPDAHFAFEPVYEYGVDGEENGILVINNGDSLFFVWTLQNDEKIRGITLLSKNISIDKNITIGMKVADYFAEFPDSRTSLDMSTGSYEYIYNSQRKFRLEFLTSDTNRIALYNMESVDPVFVKLLRPDAKVDRISID